VVVSTSHARRRFAAVRSQGVATLAAWAALAAATVAVLLPVATFDLRDRNPVGDQTSYITQTLSLAYDSHTLSFDAADSHRWRDMGVSREPAISSLWMQRGWGAEPFALFFQHYHGGWAFAKPYGYSVFAAPFVRLFDPVPGFAIANTVLMLALIALALWTVRMRLRGPAVPLAVGAFLLASFAYFYAYVAYTDLFLALLALAASAFALRYVDTRRLGWALASVAVMGYGVSEKPQFALLFLPLALVMLAAERRSPRRAVAILGVGILALGISVLPYLYYSDFKSFSPYNGDRFQLALPTRGAVVVPPWEGGRSYWSAKFDSAQAGSGTLTNKLEALAYTFVGQHTGILVFLPFAFLLLCAVLARIRSADRWTVAMLVGIAAYLVFYAVEFPTNFYGGGQSYGNRYFLQMAPTVLVLGLFARLPARLVSRLALAGIVLAVGFLLPSQLHPSRALYELWHTSIPQRLLPFEHNQQYAQYWASP
jgi:hypothetical protein